MSEEKKDLENTSGEIQNQNQDPNQEIERLKKEATDAKEETRIARDDAANYQSIADKANDKLDEKEQLDVREEGIAEREHKVFVSEIQRDYPDVFVKFPEIFNELKGSDKDEYIRNAEYLQQGIDKGKKPEENKPAENASENNQPNKDEANPLPDSSQKNNSTHIFTRAELKEHEGDQEWHAANEAEIDRQAAEGLIT